MDYKQFFDDYVTNFTPYKDDRVYQILIDHFKDKFLIDSYENIPKSFKSLYENGIIPNEVYNQFLTDLGVPNDLIDDLNDGDKFIFLRSLSDFQQYKSTVGLVSKVVKAYGNNISVYELYIDYDESYGRWICKPYLLYKPDSAEIYEKTIPYNLVYRKIPTLLISPRELDLIREQNLAAQPLKTNILFIQSDYNTSATSYIQSIVLSFFYFKYKQHQFNLYFPDRRFKISIHQYVLLYLYILFHQNETRVIDHNPTSTYVSYRLNPIDNVDEILEDYDNINTSQDQYDFYNKYIAPYQVQNDSENLETVLNVNSVEGWLNSEYEDLLLYIKEVIKSVANPYIYLINHLLDSLNIEANNTTELDFKKYFKYFRSFLPSINISSSTETAFKIIYHLKPHHTEILDLTDVNLIISEDKLNNIYFSHLEKTKILKFSDESIVEIEIPSYYHNMNALYHVEDLRFISDHRFRWLEGYVDSDYVDPDYFEDEDYFD